MPDPVLTFVLFLRYLLELFRFLFLSRDNSLQSYRLTSQQPPAVEYRQEQANSKDEVDSPDKHDNAVVDSNLVLNVSSDDKDECETVDRHDLNEPPKFRGDKGSENGENSPKKFCCIKAVPDDFIFRRLNGK